MTRQEKCVLGPQKSSVRCVWEGMGYLPWSSSQNIFSLKNRIHSSNFMTNTQSRTPPGFYCKNHHRLFFGIILSLLMAALTYLGEADSVRAACLRSYPCSFCSLQ